MDADTERLVAYLIALFEAKSGVDLRGDEAALKRVREAAARATQEWRALPHGGIAVSLPFVTATPDGPLHLDERLSDGSAKRFFEGADYSKALADARAERERELDAKRLKQAASEREREGEKRAERTSDLKIGLITASIIVAIVVSVVALSTSRAHERHDDDKAHAKDHR